MPYYIKPSEGAGFYEKKAVGIEAGERTTASHVMESILLPIGKQLDKDMAELRAEIAKLSAKPNSGNVAARKQRKTRKSRK